MSRQIMNWSRPLSPRRAKARAAIVDFGRNVRARRLSAGLRQKDLARRCHVGADVICYIERGTTNPLLETMALIAAGLNCSVADLFIPSESVLISGADAARGREALDVLGSVLLPGRRTRER